MKQNTTQSNQDSLTPKKVPSYLIKLKAKMSNEKVGQTFVTFRKQQQKNDEKENKLYMEQLKAIQIKYNITDKRLSESEEELNPIRMRQGKK